MKNLIFIFLFIGNFPLIAQNLGKNEALKDLSFLVDHIQKYNPALTKYCPKFAEQSDEVIKTVNSDSLTVFDYFTKVSKICALANEGHFSLGDWKDIAHKGIMDNSMAYFPLNVKLLSGKLYISKDYSNEQKLKKGFEIIAINGVKTTSILKKLLEIIPSDGNIKTYAYRKIEDGFPQFYLFHIEQTEAFEITYLDQNAEQKTTKITALVRSDQVVNYKKYYANQTRTNSSKSQGFYHLKYEDNYALLKLPSFDFKQVNKYEVKSKKMYESIFTELQAKNVKNLIIDLRDNTRRAQ